MSPWQRGAVGGHFHQRDRGSISIFTVIFALFVFMLAGLLVDGGQAIHARQRAADIAEQAARAAADVIDADYLRRTGEARIASGPGPCQRARKIIRQYSEVTGTPSCAVRAGRQRASVRITIRVELQLLGVIPGLGDFEMTSSETARPRAGL